MKTILLTILILLIHTESGDVDLVKSCTLHGDYITADFGFGWSNNFPADEFECKVVKEVE